MSDRAREREESATSPVAFLRHPWDKSGRTGTRGGDLLAKAWLQIIAILLGLGVALLARAADTATLDTPASVPAGTGILVKWTGPGRNWDRIGVVPVGAPDDESPDAPWSTYATGTEVWITAPETPGEYEVRIFASRRPSKNRGSSG
jgi:hypothetical protein